MKERIPKTNLRKGTTKYIKPNSLEKKVRYLIFMDR